MSKPPPKFENFCSFEGGLDKGFYGNWLVSSFTSKSFSNFPWKLILYEAFSFHSFENFLTLQRFLKKFWPQSSYKISNPPPNKRPEYLFNFFSFMGLSFLPSSNLFNTSNFSWLFISNRFKQIEIIKYKCQNIQTQRSECVLPKQLLLPGYFSAALAACSVSIDDYYKASLSLHFRLLKLGFRIFKI